MAGLSSRFFNAGFDKPKYMLYAQSDTLFAHSVLSFKEYFKTDDFLFIVRNIYDTPKFVELECIRLGIEKFKIVVLEQETRGQAETVAFGLLNAGISGDESLTIFNIDTFRCGFKYPNLNKLGDGYLEVFSGEGDNWSFVLPESSISKRVIKTTEKDPISNLCSTGLYYFNRSSDYMSAFYSYQEKPSSEWVKGELYIAPLYNELINAKKDIYYNIIDSKDVIFCGTPEEYDAFSKN